MQQALEAARRRQQRVAPNPNNATPGKTCQTHEIIGTTPPPASVASTTDQTPATGPRTRMPKRHDQATPLPESTPVPTPGQKHVKMLDEDVCKRTLFEGSLVSRHIAMYLRLHTSAPGTSTNSDPRWHCKCYYVDCICEWSRLLGVAFPVGGFRVLSFMIWGGGGLLRVLFGLVAWALYYLGWRLYNIQDTTCPCMLIYLVVIHYWYLVCHSGGGVVSVHASSVC